jgi:hypothetical protein
MTDTPERAADPSPEALAFVMNWRWPNHISQAEVARALDAFAEARVTAAVEAERERISRRVSERCILRLQADCDPVEEANEIIQDLAHDIATNWADYDEDDEQ